MAHGLQLVPDWTKYPASQLMVGTGLGSNVGTADGSGLGRMVGNGEGIQVVGTGDGIELGLRVWIIETMLSVVTFVKFNTDLRELMYASDDSTSVTLKTNASSFEKDNTSNETVHKASSPPLTSSCRARLLRTSGDDDDDGVGAWEDEGRVVGSGERLGAGDGKRVGEDK
jgi:hypothetical protein